MKLTTRDIAGFLSSPPKHCAGVLIYGEDEGLVHTRLEQMQKHWQPDGSDPFGLVSLTAEDLKQDSLRLADEAGGLALGSLQKLIVIRQATESITAQVEAMLDGMHPAIHLIVTATECGRQSKLRALFEKHDHLAALPCYALEGRSLEGYFRDKLQQAGIAFEPPVPGWLAQESGLPTGQADSLMKILALYAREGTPLAVRDIRQLLGQSGEVALETVVDAWLLNDSRKLYQGMRVLEEQAVSAIALLRALLGQIERLLVLQGQARRLGVDQAISAQRPPIFFKRVPVIRRLLTLRKPAELQAAYQLVCELEHQMKKGRLTEAALFHLLQQQSLAFAA